MALIFLSSEYGHRAHLSTRSYAAHMALNDFYTGLIGLRDQLVESYQGRNGIINIPYCDAPMEGQEPAMVLRSHLKIIEDVRYTAVSDKDTAIQNIIDEVVSLYLSTLYKLENLK